MQFVKPMPFEEALSKLGERSIVASDLTSEQWGVVPLALRERAFFSSRVESVRFLQRARDSVTDFLASNREVLDNGQVALKTGGRSDFVKGMQDFLRGEGVERTTGGLTDIAGQKRLELIFDVQTRQAQDFGYWKQGQDPDVLEAFPAQRFIRVVDVKEPRNAHQDFEGAVALKSNLSFWTRINQDFGVPWGPWGWGCGHDVEDVDRAEAEAMGLIKPGEQPVPVEKEFNDRLEAGTQGLDGDMVRFLAEAFGDQVDLGPDRVRWNVNRPAAQPWMQPTPVPVRPVGRGVPTLEDALDAAGLTGKTVAMEADMIRLIEELKEDRPMDVSQVLKSVSIAGKSALSEAKVREMVQEFLSFLPPQKAAALPKLTVSVRHRSGVLGSYLHGGVQLEPRLSGVDALQTMFHELGHWLHMDGEPKYKQEIKDHFQARTKGEKIAPLPGYSRKTRGKRDKFYSAYAGRIYEGQSYDSAEGNGLEVPTRYLELLADPKELAKNWADADFRETMMVVLRGLF